MNPAQWKIPNIPQVGEGADKPQTRWRRAGQVANKLRGSYEFVAKKFSDVTALENWCNVILALSNV